MISKRSIFALAAGLATVVVAAAAASDFTLRYRSPTGAKYGAWAPSSGSVSAMSRLPAQAGMPADVSDLVARMASATHGDAATAVASLRKLRGNLGSTSSSIYAFRPASGERALCYVLTSRGDVCPTAASSPTPGVVWGFDGGYPSVIAAAKVLVPGALSGVVADEVSGVSLISNGNEQSLELINNAFFVEIATPTPGDAWDESLRIDYSDGSSKTLRLPDPRD